MKIQLSPPHQEKIHNNITQQKKTENVVLPQTQIRKNYSAVFFPPVRFLPFRKHRAEPNPVMKKRLGPPWHHCAGTVVFSLTLRRFTLSTGGSRLGDDRKSTNETFPKGIFIFQPWIFRGELLVSFREGISKVIITVTTNIITCLQIMPFP